MTLRHYGQCLLTGTDISNKSITTSKTLKLKLKQRRQQEQQLKSSLDTTAALLQLSRYMLFHEKAITVLSYDELLANQ